MCSHVWLLLLRWPEWLGAVYVEGTQQAAGYTHCVLLCYTCSGQLPGPGSSLVPATCLLQPGTLSLCAPGELCISEYIMPANAHQDASRECCLPGQQPVAHRAGTTGMKETLNSETKS
jgi:hypothetical protein